MSANYDLSIDQGADWAVQIAWTSPQGKPYAVLPPMRMDIRSAGGGLLYSLTSDEEGETTEDSISYNTDSGLIQLQLSSAVTNDFDPGLYLYDLFVGYSDSTVVRKTRLLSGKVNVNGRITQEV